MPLDRCALRPCLHRSRHLLWLRERFGPVLWFQFEFEFEFEFEFQFEFEFEFQFQLEFQL
ncbi:MAG TPA: hypothetical protein VNT01_17645 [Symbiobacteriaceae bacterium]|nr:hypothetical protein [Symbiobacteriaceae bacterium]